MRPTSALTLTLLLLVVLPSGVLAWLGLRSADAFAAADLEALRAARDAELERWRARGPALHDQVAARIQRQLDARAEALAADLPGLPPAAIARRMARARSRLEMHVPGIRALRLLDASGRPIHPVPWREVPPEAAARDASRAGLLAHLRQEADRAWYGGGGAAAALAVWTEAAAHARSPATRLRLEVEAARVRARAGHAEALAAARALDEAHDEQTLLAVGRPVLLLWSVAGGEPDPAAASAPGAPYRERLQRLADAGVLDGMPLTSEERDRLARYGSRLQIPVAGSGSGPGWAYVQRPLEAPTTTWQAALPGGARLVARLSREGLLKQLALVLRGQLGPAPGLASVAWLEGHSDRQPGFALLYADVLEPLPPAEAPFRAASQGVVGIPLPDGIDGIDATLHVTRAGWRAAAESNHERRRWTYLVIALLVLVTLGGALVLRRAVLRERAARRLRDDFIANVTHEVRTPLTSVLLHADLLAAETEDPARRRAHAAVVQAQGQRLAALVDDMLDFAALERGTRALDCAPVDLAAACREAVQPYGVLAEREGVSLAVALPAGELAALADPAALARILSNLVGNAWKHGRPSADGHPGRLRILADATASGGWVEVRDDGPGIPAGERAEVFERFGRGGASARVEGAGIGLALSRDLAVAMGGTLTMAREDGETVFRLTLPPVPPLDEELP